jgi:ankyrin repeat protein
MPWMMTHFALHLIDIVELLLNRDADIHALDDDALCVASEKGHLNVVELLLDNDADMHANDDYSLRRAYDNGHMAVVELLCQQTNCAQPR